MKTRLGLQLKQLSCPLIIFTGKKSLKAAENNSRAGKWIINIDEKRPNNEILGGPAPESSKWKTFLQDNAVVLGGKSD